MIDGVSTMCAQLIAASLMPNAVIYLHVSVFQKRPTIPKISIQLPLLHKIPFLTSRRFLIQSLISVALMITLSCSAIFSRHRKRIRLILTSKTRCTNFFIVLFFHMVFRLSCKVFTDLFLGINVYS